MKGVTSKLNAAIPFADLEEFCDHFAVEYTTDASELSKRLQSRFKKQLHSKAVLHVAQSPVGRGLCVEFTTADRLKDSIRCTIDRYYGNGGSINHWHNCVRFTNEWLEAGRP